jgi:hypothetical protein
MNSILVSMIVFACVFAGALFGMYLRVALPEHHLSAASIDAVKVGMALVATMCAIVLGLLVSSAKSAYDAQSIELTGLSAKLVMLDRILEHYGSDTKQMRESLRATVVSALNRLEAKNSSETPSRLEPQVTGATGAESIFDKIEGLSPKDETQRSLQARASGIAFDLLQTRWLMFEQAATPISLPMLIVLIFWLTVLFVSFGLFAPWNTTVVISYLIAAVSVSAAIFLIVEMYTPYSGLIHVSGTPLRAAIAHLGQ